MSIFSLENQLSKMTKPFEKELSRVVKVRLYLKDWVRIASNKDLVISGSVREIVRKHFEEMDGKKNA